MKHFIYIILIILASAISFIIGRYDYHQDINGKIYSYSIKKSLNAERQYCNAVLESLHWYYRQDTTKWANEFVKTKEYKNIEIANQGDWEDFYAPEWK